MRPQLLIACAVVLGACSREADPPDLHAFHSWVAASSSPLVVPFTPAELATLLRTHPATRLVGAGDGAHGAHEHALLKGELVKALVQQRGFTVLAVEVGAAEAFRVDDYVVHGHGDAKTALHGLHYWIANTSEMLDLVEWMRSWNRDARHTRKLRFYGIDAQLTDTAARTVSARLRAHDPQLAARFAATLARFDVPNSNVLYRQLTKAEVAELREQLDVLASEVAARRAAWANDDAKRIADGVRTLRQFVAAFTGRGVNVRTRDAYMAENVASIREREGVDAGVMVWAHNGHVSHRLRAMGVHLRARYPDYVAIGMLFGGGAVTAIPDQTPRIERCAEAPAERGSWNGELARSRSGSFVLSLAAPDAGAKQWMSGIRPMLEIGAASFGKGRNYRLTVPIDEFDSIVFTERVTPTHLLP